MNLILVAQDAELIVKIQDTFQFILDVYLNAWKATSPEKMHWANSLLLNSNFIISCFWYLSVWGFSKNNYRLFECVQHNISNILSSKDNVVEFETLKCLYENCLAFRIRIKNVLCLYDLFCSIAWCSFKEVLGSIYCELFLTFSSVCFWVRFKSVAKRSSLCKIFDFLSVLVGNRIKRRFSCITVQKFN